MQEDVDNRPWTLLLVAWLVSFGASLGSLFFSEVMELPPCSLCWYQRIFMFPLAVILPFGLFPLDPKVVRYTLPLAIGGCLLAVYHMLLQWGVISKSLAPCRDGVSCSDAQVAIFGVFSIPVLSFVAFATLTALLIALKKESSK